jgi:hypothetical protein
MKIWLRKCKNIFSAKKAICSLLFRIFSAFLEKRNAFGPNILIKLGKKPQKSGLQKIAISQDK